LNNKSPQAENGHIDIANEIAEALMKTQLSGYQSRILWVIWRKTYGWHKKEDIISISQFVDLTGLRKAHVCRTINELVERKIVTKNGNKYGFNKIYTYWRELPKMVTVTKNGNGVTNNGNKSLPKMGHTKETTKETITKETKEIYKEIFDYWISLDIVAHKNLTSRQETKIRSALKDYSKEDIKKSMINYRDVLKSDKHYWTKIWTMENFLSRGLGDFMDEAMPLESFKKFKQQQSNPAAIQEADPNYDADASNPRYNKFS